MKENRYFLITACADNLSHAFCGIGITDGSWTFNDVEYDKCILTLDSNIRGSDGNPRGFSNKCCIYINSQTKQTYIPSYDTGTEHEIIFAAIDDDELLNYKGIIKSSESVSDEVTRVKHISCHSGNEEIYAISENSEKLPLNESIFRDSGGNVYLDTADRYCLLSIHAMAIFRQSSHSDIMSIICTLNFTLKILHTECFVYATAYFYYYQAAVTL